MNMNATFPRLSSLMLLLVMSVSLLQAQTDSTFNDPAEEVTAVVVKSDTTEIAWRDRKFVIISEDGVKRVEIIEVPNGESDDDEEEDGGWGEDDGDDFDPEYDSKEDVAHKSRGYSDVGLLGFDLGLMNYYSAAGFGADAITGSPDLEVRDFRVGSHVALHLFPTTVSLIGRGAVNLKTAVTIDWSNHYFKGDNVIVESGESYTFEDRNIDFEKNKLTVRYAQIPLLLNFNTTPRSDDGVSISVGGYAGILWNARSKQESVEEGVVKVDGDFGLSPFRYGLMGRIDFKWFDFYVMYNLTPMFEEGAATDAQTVMAGVNIVNF